MTTEPHRPVTGALLRLQWTDTHGVYGDASDEIATDYCETRDARRVLRAPARSGTNLLPTRRLRTSSSGGLFSSRPRPGGWDGEIDFDVDPVRVIDPTDRVVPRRPTPAGGERSIATPVAGPRMARRAGSASRSRGSGRERTRTSGPRCPAPRRGPPPTGEATCRLRRTC